MERTHQRGVRETGPNNINAKDVRTKAHVEKTNPATLERLGSRNPSACLATSSGKETRSVHPRPPVAGSCTQRPIPTPSGEVVQRNAALDDRAIASCAGVLRNACRAEPREVRRRRMIGNDEVPSQALSGVSSPTWPCPACSSMAPS